MRLPRLSKVLPKTSKFPTKANQSTIPPKWIAGGLAALVALVMLLASGNLSLWGLLVAIGVGGVVVGLFQLPERALLVVSLVVLVIGGGGLAITGSSSGKQQESTADQEALQTRAQLLPNTPLGVLQAIHTLLGQKNLDGVCSYFNDEAGQQFAQANGATNCPSAVGQLGAQVTDASRYGAFKIDEKTAITIAGDSAVVDGCAVYWG